MKPSIEQVFKQDYEAHLKHLRLKGLQPKTIDAYARGIRRIGGYFGYEIRDLSQEQLMDYFLRRIEDAAFSFGLDGYFRALREGDRHRSIFIPSAPFPRARPTNGSDRGSLRSHDLTLFVSELRARLDLPNDAEVSDQEILDGTDGTFFRAQVEMSIAASNIAAAIAVEFKRTCESMRKIVSR